MGRWTSIRRYCRSRQAAEGLAQRGVLAKETHDIYPERFAPPLIITEELDWMLDQFEAVLDAAMATD